MVSTDMFLSKFLSKIQENELSSAMTKTLPLSDNVLVEEPSGPIPTRPYFAKLIDRCVNHKLSRVRTDDISGTIFRPGQTNIKGSDGLPLRRAVLGQMSADAMVDIKCRP